MAQHQARAGSLVGIGRDLAAVFLRPSSATFRRVTAGATWAQVGLLVGLTGLLTGLLRLAGSGLTGLEPLPAVIGGVMITLFLFSVLTLLLLYIADRFRGQGDTVDHVYAVALIWTPFTVLAGLPAIGDLVWLVGACLGLPALLYGTYLTYCAMQGVHGLDEGAARFVALTPAILVILLMLIGVGVTFLLTTNTLVVPEG